MDNLADKVIAANTAAEEALLQEGKLKLDDIGLPLPEPDTERAWCEYLVARLLYLNPRLYTYLGLLWLGHEPIKENKNSYYVLAHYPRGLSDPECQYVWRRAKELVPELDTSKIAILPNLTFNMQTGEIKHEKVWTITPWGERGGDNKGEKGV